MRHQKSSQVQGETMSSAIETVISIPKDQGKIMDVGDYDTQTCHLENSLVSEETSYKGL